MPASAESKSSPATAMHWDVSYPLPISAEGKIEGRAAPYRDIFAIAGAFAIQLQLSQLSDQAWCSSNRALSRAIPSCASASTSFLARTSGMSALKRPKHSPL
eukprot:2233586-Rhodomonas_salina.1